MSTTASGVTGPSAAVSVSMAERLAQAPDKRKAHFGRGAHAGRLSGFAGRMGVIGAASLLLLATGASNADEPTAPPRCAMRLSLEVTPDVPDPGAGGFLSSLLGDHPEYQLFLLSRDDDTHVTLQLQGPGPTESCRAVLASMRNDGRVQSIHVN